MPSKTEVDLIVEGCFAGLHVHDSGAGAQSIPDGLTYTKVTGWTGDGDEKNCIANIAESKITITKAGVYHISGAISFSSTGIGIDWFGAPFIDGVEVDKVHFQRSIGTGGDKGAAPLTGNVTISTVPVDLDFRVRHDDNTAEDFTMTYANLNVNRIGTV